MGEINLEWKDHDKTLSTRLWECFKEEYLVDFNVTCHGQQMKVHKFILALMFPMLKESFISSGTLPFDHEELSKDASVRASLLSTPLCLNLDNIADHPEDMNYLIQFAYTGKATVPKEHVNCLKHIANSMEIKCLKESLGQRNDMKGKRKAQTEIRNATLRRLRSLTQAKEVKLSEDSVILGSSDKEVVAVDLDFHSTADEESSLVYSDESSNSEDDQIISRSRQKKIEQNRRKSSSSNHSKKKPVKNQKKAKKLQKTTANDRSPSQVQKTSTDDIIKEQKILKCSQCDYVGKYPCNLERHVRSHARKEAKGPNQFTCGICKKGFERKNLLNVHRDSKCGTEPLSCKYCGLKINKKATLLHHIMAKHQLDAEGNPLEKNLKCPDCDFVCYAKHQLRAHASAKHERQNKFKCKECNFTAPYRHELLRHDRVIHQNVRDFMCEECGHRFPNSGKLKSHVLVRHKGVKPYKCDICNAEYSNRLSFKIHMQSHEGKVEYKFICHICGHTVRRKCELRIHVRNKHSMELEEVIPNKCRIEEEAEPQRDS